MSSLVGGTALAQWLVPGWHWDGGVQFQILVGGMAEVAAGAGGADRTAGVGSVPCAAAGVAGVCAGFARRPAACERRKPHACAIDGPAA